MGKKLSRPEPVTDLLKKMAAKGIGNMETTDDNVKQWVETVTNFSSEYDANNWQAGQIIGPPKVYPAYGDKPGAWASRVKDANQFIQVHFKDAVFVTGIDIYETFHAGGVKAILGKTEEGKWQSLYKTDAVTVIKSSRIFSPKLKEMDCKTQDMRIEVDCTACGTWVELDAVQLRGKIYRTAPPPSMEVLADNLQLLINDPRFSDVEFIVDGKTVCGHKAILSVRSEYFRAMFCNDMQEARSKRIELKDVPIEIFVAVVHYLYTNRLPDIHNGVTLTEIWRAADRFSLEGLKTLTSFTICKKMNETNVVDLYVSASSRLPIIDEVKDNCLSYMSSHMSKIVNTPSFVDLPQQTMLEIIQSATSRLQLE